MNNKSPIPTDLTSWQKKYGPGFVMYSLKTGRVLDSAPNYKKLIQKTSKKKVDNEKVSVIYIPDVRTVSIF